MGSSGPPNRTRRHPNIRLAALEYADCDGLYNITVCSRERQPVFTDPGLAEDAIRLLRWLRTQRKTAVWAYCLMPEHLHLLLSPRQGDSISRLMHSYKVRTTQRSWSHGHSGKLWQDRFHDRILRQRDSGIEVVEYIFDNPIRRGLVARRRDYPYSGELDVLIPGLLDEPPLPASPHSKM